MYWFLLLFYKKHQEEDEKVEAVLDGDTSTVTQDITIPVESDKTIQSENSSDIINEDTINEQTDNRKEISD